MKLTFFSIVVLFSLNLLAQDGSRIQELSSEINNSIQSFDKYEQLTGSERHLLRSSLKEVKFIIEDLGLDTMDDSSFYCKHTRNNYYRLINLATREEMDDSGTSQEVCNKRLKLKSNIYCKHTRNNYFRLTRKDRTEIDLSGTSLEICLKRLPKRSQKLVCRHTRNDYFRVTTLAGIEIDNSGTSLSFCESRL